MTLALAAVGVLALLHVGTLAVIYGPKATLALLLAPLAVAQDPRRRRQLRHDIEQELDS